MSEPEKKFTSEPLPQELYDEGYRLIADMQPHQQAYMDQMQASTRQWILNLITLYREHWQLHQAGHPELASNECVFGCGSVDLYEHIRMLDLSQLQQVIMSVARDAVRNDELKELDATAEGVLSPEPDL